MMIKIPKAGLYRLLLIAPWFIALMLASLSGFSQSVAVNASNSPANSVAGLDIDFAGKGFLIPRVALSGTGSFAPLSAHVAGMMVYNTSVVSDVTSGLYFSNGVKWVSGSTPGTTNGDMQIWDGAKWTVVSGGIAGQYLSAGAGGIPVWTGQTSAYATLSTVAISVITTTSASSGGNITNAGSSAIIARGVCWDTAADPTIALLTKTIDGSGIGAFTSSITGLTSGMTYYIRAYATNSQGTVYGNQLTFTTN